MSSKNQHQMRVLSETNNLILCHEFEVAWLKDKSTGKELFRDEFYGDPECGLIDGNNNWAVVAGEHLTIWSNNQINILSNPDLKWVSAIRNKARNTIEVLIDPWSKESAIWEIDINTLNTKKIRDFSDYKEKEYTEDIVW